MSKILIIDDERSIRNTLKDILEFEKHEVTLAEDGLVGLELLKNESFDLISSTICFTLIRSPFCWMTIIIVITLQLFAKSCGFRNI